MNTPRMTEAEIATYEQNTRATARDMLANGWTAHEIVLYIAERDGIASSARDLLAVTK